MSVLDQFRLDGKHALVTGGTGGLGRGFAQALAEAGATVHIAGRKLERAEAVAAELRDAGLAAHGVAIDVMQREQLEQAAQSLPPIDILINGAGGNVPEATATADRSFFDLPSDALEHVVGLNLFGGAILPSQVFGRRMAEADASGVIINITSVSADLPLTRVLGYGASKAAVSNFTRWLAVHMAQEYNPRIRVNAVAPGFFLTDQNRYLLVDQASGEPTERAKLILANTPMGRFGEPADLAGGLLWLCSDAAAFVTGVVLPIDGGFTAFSGV